MNISASVSVNLRTREAEARIRKATARAVKDTVIEIENTAKKGSPVDTGTNRRSITSQAEELSGQIYSTSGYGGYLEVGTSKMAAQPYFKPALDEHFTEDKFAEKIEANL